MKLRDRIVRFQRVKGKDLLPNEHNWRTHPEAQQNAMRAILAKFGIAGAHLAFETEHGLKLIDGHLRTDIEPDTMWPVLVTDFTEEEAREFIMYYDPIGELAEADRQILGESMARYQTDNEHLQAILDGLAEEHDIDLFEEPLAVTLEDQAAPVDRAAELLQKWQVKPEQIWQVGPHRLMCGDATNRHDVERLLDGAVPLLMVTDPPYGVNYDPEWRKQAGINDSDRMGAVTNDDRVDWRAAYANFPGDIAYVWHGHNHSGEVVEGVESCNLLRRSMIVWVKQQFAIGRGAYHWQHEACVYAVRKGRNASWNGDRTQSTVWQITSILQNDEAKEIHATQKPIECMARPIRNHGGAEAAVYDPFVGSGTTIAAAHGLGRVCYAMDVSPSYCAVALERLSKMQLVCRPLEPTNGETADPRRAPSQTTELRG